MARKLTKPKIAGRRGRPPAGTEDWAKAFLLALECGCHVRAASAEANVDGTLPYKRRKTDAAFRAAWDEAARIGTQELEREVTRRAYHGTLKPVFYQGAECGLVSYLR